LKNDFTEYKEISSGKIIKLSENINELSNKINIITNKYDEFVKYIQVNDVLCKELLNKNKEFCNDLINVVKRCEVSQTQVSSLQSQISDLYKTKFTNMKQ
jgi:hypothetical protein